MPKYKRVTVTESDHAHRTSQVDVWLNPDQVTSVRENSRDNQLVDVRMSDGETYTVGGPISQVLGDLQA